MTRNSSAIPADTSAEVWRIQMAAIARRSVAERMSEWEALNREVAVMEADAVRRRHPDYSERQVFLTLVRHRYGDDLAFEIWPDAYDMVNRSAAS